MVFKGLNKTQIEFHKGIGYFVSYNTVLLLKSTRTKVSFEVKQGCIKGFLDKSWIDFCPCVPRVLTDSELRVNLGECNTTTGLIRWLRSVQELDKAGGEVLYGAVKAVSRPSNQTEDVRISY